MYHVRLPTGNEAVFKTIQELALAIRRGVVQRGTVVHHQKLDRWLPIEQHPHYERALATDPFANTAADESDGEFDLLPETVETPAPVPTPAVIAETPAAAAKPSWSHSKKPTAKLKVGAPPRPASVATTEATPVVEPPVLAQPEAAIAPAPKPDVAIELPFIDVSAPTPPKKKVAAVKPKKSAPAIEMLDLMSTVPTSAPAPEVPALIVEPARTEPARTESVQPEPVRPEPVPAAPVPAAPVHLDLVHVDPTPVAQARPEPMPAHVATDSLFKPDAADVPTTDAAPIPAIAPVRRARRGRGFPLRATAAALGTLAFASALGFFAWRAWTQRGGTGIFDADREMEGMAAAPAPVDSVHNTISAAIADSASVAAVLRAPAKTASDAAREREVTAAPVAKIRAGTALDAVTTPAALARRYVTSYGDARAAVEEGLALVHYGQSFLPERLKSPDSIRVARRSVAAAGNTVRVYRSAELRMERAYRDSAEYLTTRHSWGADGRVWNAGRSLRESFETDQKADSVVMVVDSVLGIFAAQRGQFQWVNGGVTFSDADAARSYATLREWLQNATQRWSRNADDDWHTIALLLAPMRESPLPALR